ncbi:MAG: hypothetical protein KDI46_07420 [Alphaproteobacteria bacterium]|nr:hypothetical protein [Alphaproteobacteria bacterium]
MDGPSFFWLFGCIVHDNVEVMKRLSLCVRTLLTSSLVFVFTAPALARNVPLPAVKPSIGAVQDRPEIFQVSYLGDTEKSCGALSAEAARMRDIIYTTADLKNKSKLQTNGVTAAGAVGSLVVGSVTGGIGLALGGFLLEHNISETSERADEVQDIAEQRRSLMMGIYNAKGCVGPIEHAMQNPDKFNLLNEIAALEPAAGEEKPRARYNQ